MSDPFQQDEYDPFQEPQMPRRHSGNKKFNQHLILIGVISVAVCAVIATLGIVISSVVGSLRNAVDATSETRSEVAEDTDAKPFWSNDPMASTADKKSLANRPLPPGLGLAAQGANPSPISYRWDEGNCYVCDMSMKIEDPDESEKTLQFTAKSAYRVTDKDPKSRLAKEERGESSSTGFVVHPDGVLVTCAHCVENATDIRVHVNGQDYKGTVIRFDPGQDLALVRIEASNLDYLRIADPETIQLAEDVRVIGYPLSDALGKGVKVTQGSISGLADESDDEMLQVDAMINPGNSGGPAVDEQGDVVGVASKMLALEEYNKIGFFVPSSQVLSMLEEAGVPVEVSKDDEASIAPTDMIAEAQKAVAFLEVTSAPGGVGTGELAVVEYISVVKLHVDGEDTPICAVRGEMVVDSAGQVIESDECHHTFPLLLTPMNQLGLERLPLSDEQKWKAIRIAPLIRERGSRGIGPSRSGRPELVEVLPALETTSYEIVEETETTATLQKSSSLKVIVGGSRLGLEIESKGTVVFNKETGLPNRTDFDTVLKAVNPQTKKEETIPISLDYSLSRVDEVPDDMKDVVQYEINPLAAQFLRKNFPKNDVRSMLPGKKFEDYQP